MVFVENALPCNQFLMFVLKEQNLFCLFLQEFIWWVLKRRSKTGIAFSLYSIIQSQAHWGGLWWRWVRQVAGMGTVGGENGLVVTKGLFVLIQFSLRGKWGITIRIITVVRRSWRRPRFFWRHSSWIRIVSNKSDMLDTFPNGESMYNGMPGMDVWWKRALGSFLAGKGCQARMHGQRNTVDVRSKNLRVLWWKLCLFVPKASWRKELKIGQEILPLTVTGTSTKSYSAAP